MGEERKNEENSLNVDCWNACYGLFFAASYNIGL
jgi:hypothetical protein